jgi:3-isopropylmalate/(R)-2-methylmalate dehydratase small subunit
MDKFKKLISRAVPVAIENIDTDQIIPARFLKATTREGFGENLFRDWRFNQDGTSVEDFPLNNSDYSGEILVAGKNFGCGSSREHAAWSIGDYGFKAVVSSFFADIFKNNALNNGILPVQVSQDFLNATLNEIQTRPGSEIIIDLEAQEISLPSISLKENFDINAFKKECLLNGYDDFDFLVSKQDLIEKFEANSIYSLN